VYFATNKIVLYENGKRIKDSSVLNDRGHQAPVCKNGICKIGQQYDSVTFYRTNVSNILNYDEWLKNNTGGFSDYENIYLKRLKDAALYSTTISLPPPGGGEDCKGEMCLGGRIGNDRTLKVDIQKDTADIQEEPHVVIKFIQTIICFIKGIFGKNC
jgi:hypothetical protein